jgi:hypothetical protein
VLYEIFPHPYAPLLATLLWSVVICGVAQLVVFRVPLFEPLIKAPIVPPFMALPAILFAFLMAFMASSAWQNISLARTSLVNEQAALARLAAVPIGPAAAKQQMQAGLQRYLAAVLDDEWALRFNERASADAEAALDSLTTGIWAIGSQCRAQAGAVPDCMSDLAVSTYLKALDDLRTARGDRLSLGFQGTLRLKWVLAIVLTLATALSIASIHRSSARTSAIALALYGLSIWMTFAMVALHIQPYRGPDALSPGVLQVMRSKV